MKLITSVLLFCFSWNFIAMAQTTSTTLVAQPAIIAAVPAAGIMGWVNAHGGFQAAVLLLVGSAFAILSAIRQVLLAFDGVGPGATSVPPGLTVLNKVCLFLGKVIDFLQGNIQH